MKTKEEVVQKLLECIQSRAIGWYVGARELKNGEWYGKAAWVSTTQQGNDDVLCVNHLWLSTGGEVVEQIKTYDLEDYLEMTKGPSVCECYGNETIRCIVDEAKRIVEQNHECNHLEEIAGSPFGDNVAHEFAEAMERGKNKWLN